jgi:acetate kinase
MTLVLVLNTGSSSIKYQLVDMGDRSVVLSGLVERIGDVAGGGVADHAEGVARILAALPDSEPLAGIGHRVVHGGERTGAARVDDELLAELGRLVDLAPLHQPAALAAIRVALDARPEVPAVACFDTAFHATLPAPAATYALPAFSSSRSVASTTVTAHTLSRCLAKRGTNGAGMCCTISTGGAFFGSRTSRSSSARGPPVDAPIAMIPVW